MAAEERLVDGDVLDADAGFVAPDLLDTIHQQERIAVRKQLQDLLDVQAFGRRRRRHIAAFQDSSDRVCRLPELCLPARDAICSRIFISRNQILAGFAGIPPQRAPGGTSSLTMLVAAMCAPSP